MAAKAADAFRTISEVSTELGVPKHVLRFWEQRFKQLKPLKRGGGRRFYRPEDVELIKGIQTLLNRDAYTIRGVQRILKEHGVERVKGLATGSAGSLIASSTVSADARSPAPNGSTAPIKRKKARAGASATTAAAPIDRDLVAKAIAELAACRMLLLGEGSKPRSRTSEIAAVGRR